MGNKVILGLSDLNIQKLTTDHPIIVKLKELGLPDIEIVIIHGKTEDEMTKMFNEAGLLHPTRTIFKDDRSDKN